MEIKKSKAILIRKKRFSNSSLILDFVTTDSGRVNTILKGGRSLSKRSKIDKSTDLLSLCEIVYYYKPDQLSILTESFVYSSFSNIRKSLERWIMGYLFADLITLASYPENDEYNLFCLLLNHLYQLNKEEDTKRLLLSFYAGYLDFCGVLPDFSTCSITRESILQDDSFAWCPAIGQAYKLGTQPIYEAFDVHKVSTIKTLYSIMNGAPIKILDEEFVSLRLLLQEQIAILHNKYLVSMDLIDQFYS